MKVELDSSSSELDELDDDVVDDEEEDEEAFSSGFFEEALEDPEILSVSVRRWFGIFEDGRASVATAIGGVECIACSVVDGGGRGEEIVEGEEVMSSAFGQCGTVSW